MKQNLLDVVKSDIAYFNQLHSEKYLYSYWLELIPNHNLDCSVYSLALNGGELWCGDLKEINAIVKSMIIREERNDFI